MSASYENIKTKLTADAIKRIVTSGNMDMLLFDSPCHPVMTGQEWSLRKCTESNSIIYISATDGSVNCYNRFTAAQVKLLLRGEVTRVFGRTLELTDLVVPEGAQLWLKNNPDLLGREDQSEIVPISAEDEMAFSDGLQPILPPSKTGYHFWNKDSVPLDPERKKMMEERIRSCATRAARPW